LEHAEEKADQKSIEDEVLNIKLSKAESVKSAEIALSDNEEQKG
jgi:hypothetical protein